MFLKEFYYDNNDQVLIDARQASRFAKDIAGDFNPLHDQDAKRFCVPGDLLFSLVLEKYGLSQKMNFTFSGMVGRDVALNFPDTEAQQFSITDAKGKTYLQVNRNGTLIEDTALLETFIRKYVAFSGPNFPHVLVPLMAKHNVMINTERPLVIYDSMSFELNDMNFSNPDLEPADTTLDVNGKRGVAHLHFNIKANQQLIGRGFKKLVISGMRAYDQPTIQRFVDNYLEHMAAYQSM